MQRLVESYPTRDPPGYVLGGLRAIDPRAELVWLGLYGLPGRTAKGEPATVWKPAWMLGLVYDDAPHRRQAVEGLELFAQAQVAKQHPARIRLWRLKYQGFHPVLIWPGGIADSGVVLDFAAQQWIKRHMYELATAQAMHEADDERDLERRLAVIADMNETETKSVWRHVWRGRRSILVN